MHHLFFSPYDVAGMEFMTVRIILSVLLNGKSMYITEEVRWGGGGHKENISF
jgi:hypothetical protein